MASSTTSHPAGSTIPQLHTMAASIFVPIPAGQDLLGPFEPPRGRVTRLQKIIEAIDEHAKAVRGNMQDLVSQERMRVVEIGKAEEKMFMSQQQQQQQNQQGGGGGGAEGRGPKVLAPMGILPHEADEMIANMEAPSAPPQQQQQQQIPTGPKSLRQGNLPEPMDIDHHQHHQHHAFTPAEDTARQVALLFRRYSEDLSGFNAHVARTRAFYEQALRRELESEAR